MYMKDWKERLDVFLLFNEHKVLKNPGKVQTKIAEQFANEQYEVFHQQRLINPPKDNFEHFLENNNLKS